MEWSERREGKTEQLRQERVTLLHPTKALGLEVSSEIAAGLPEGSGTLAASPKHQPPGTSPK